MPLPSLSDVADLDALIEQSRTQPVLLFKHSRSCGISYEALDEVRSHVAHAGATARMITVQSQREISDAAERRLGIRHQTPQAILLHGGRPVWSASHFRITAAELDRALKSCCQVSAF
jgi:thioredoxin 1